MQQLNEMKVRITSIIQRRHQGHAGATIAPVSQSRRTCDKHSDLTGPCPRRGPKGPQQPAGQKRGGASSDAAPAP